MNGLLPGQFADKIGEPRTRSEPPKRFWKAIVQARKRRRKDLVAIDEEAYAEPLLTALFLYRRDPPKHRPLVLSAIGSSSSPDIWRNLAAAARDAWDASDWTLLGALAYRADEARARQARPHPPELERGGDDSRETVPRDAESAGEEGGEAKPQTQAAGSAEVENEEVETNLILDDGSDENDAPVEKPPAPQPAEPAPALPAIALALTERFKLAFNFEAGCVEAGQYVQSVLGYLRFLPATFVVPNDLVLPGAEAARSGGEGSSAEDESWPILREFWLRHSGAWHAVPTAADEVGTLPCGFLKFFVERHQASPPGKSPSAVKRPNNPFAKLAVGHAEEPPEVAPDSPDLQSDYDLVEPVSDRPVAGDEETSDRSDSRGGSARLLPWWLDTLRSTGFGGRYAGSRSVWRRFWAAVRGLWGSFRRWLNLDERSP